MTSSTFSNPVGIINSLLNKQCHLNSLSTFMTSWNVKEIPVIGKQLNKLVKINMSFGNDSVLISNI